MKKVSVMFSLVFLVSIMFSLSAQAQTQTKKKWSPQAKGAVIGTATGATAGAIIHKRNRVVGGVVGGVVGAGAGYGVGKIIDNKNKKEAAEAARVAAENRAAAANRAAIANRAEANRNAAAKRSQAPAKTIKKQQDEQQVLGTYHTLVANNPASMYDEAGKPMANLLSGAYLANEYYGDRTKPYYTSEYRRKSW